MDKNFKILEIPYVWPKNIIKKKSKIGFNPNLFTEETLNKYFGNDYSLVPVNFNFNNKYKNKNPICGDEMEISLIVKNNKVEKINKFFIHFWVKVPSVAIAVH